MKDRSYQLLIESTYWEKIYKNRDLRNEERERRVRIAPTTLQSKRASIIEDFR